MVRRSLGTSDWKAAQRMALDWEEAAPPANLQPTASASLAFREKQDKLVTVEECCARIVADAMARSLADDTIAKYRLLERGLLDFARGKKIVFMRDLDLSVLTEFRAGWKIAPRTAAKRLDRLRSFFSFAQQRGWISANPAKEIKSPRVREVPTMPFTNEEMARILAAASARPALAQSQGKDNARRLKALILLLRYSGLRLGDAARLSTEKIVNGRLWLKTAKTGTHVFCPLPDFVVHELESIPKATERFYFWTGQTKPRYAAKKWDELLRPVFQAAGLKDGHAHRFRDTFAVELLLSGVPLERVSMLLGHSSVRITEKHYAPWVTARQEQAEADVRRSWMRDPLALIEGVCGTEAENPGADIAAKNLN